MVKPSFGDIGRAIDAMRAQQPGIDVNGLYSGMMRLGLRWSLVTPDDIRRVLARRARVHARRNFPALSRDHPEKAQYESGGRRFRRSRDSADARAAEPQYAFRGAARAVPRLRHPALGPGRVQVLELAVRLSPDLTLSR